jgi:hypothetical protein
MALDPIYRDPPFEHETDMLVHAFESAASQIESALVDPAMRRLLLGNRDRILAACETALAIEALVDAPALSAAE